ncbi:MAG TPA: right-handed parallel beta-helix repeat-containing protein [Candidatus Thermoplasmatota archaeon]|nr:right-handed parallel beta-helix repeat-containing protein [Candidatus Thermoplasmatota archaeon]
MHRGLLALAALALLSALAAPAEASHGGTIRASSDADLVGPHWSGAGTAADPARLVVPTLTPSGGYAVELSNIRKHVNLSGLAIGGGGSQSDAIRLTNVTNVTIWDATLESNRVGIHVKQSQDVLIAGSTVKTSGTGILLEASRGVTLRDNRIALNDRDVSFRQSWGNTLRENNLSTATGQVGLFFEDNASYDNSIATSNVVNGIPVRWYTGASHVVISDATVDLTGITNVAQVMVYNSTGVTLERPVAKSGIGSGILVMRSQGVTLTAPVAEGNARSGIHVELANGTRIANASARNNGASGVNVQSAHDTALEWSTLAGNGREGVRVTNATNLVTLRHLTSASNGQRGVHVEGSRNVTLADSSFTSDAVAFLASRDLDVRRNALSGAAPAGFTLQATTAGRFESNSVRDRATAVSFAASTRNQFAENTIGLSGLGFAFDGPQSYDNELAPTNLVNGTAVRWYTNVAGPVVLPDVAVELRGITNVAQIGVIRSGNLTFLNATAKNGSAAGILVWDSHGVNFTNASVSANAGDGVAVDGGSTFKLFHARVTSSGADGVRLKGTHGPLVENTLVESSRGRGIHAELGQAPTLRGNALRDNGGIGISLDRVGPGAAAAEHNVLERNAGGGIVASSSAVGTLRSNTIRANGQDGISLASVPAGARVELNQVSEQARAIRLRAAGGTELHANTLAIGSGQFGVHFDDETSYAVTLPPTNTVNGVPVRWYAGISGVHVANVSVELRGITNVAQVMLYKAQNVTLADAVAANGSARGIQVLRSANVTLERPRAEANNDSGIALSLSNDTRVRGGETARNLQVGLRIEGSPRASVDEVTLRGNANGLDVVNGSSLLRLANATFRDNGVRGLMVNASSATLVRDNLFLGHERAVQMDRANGTTFLANNVTLRANDTAWFFAGAASYESDVGPSNLVNGVPMRWHTRLKDATLAGVRADVRGMTNVAQVALLRPENVELVGALAANGTLHGIYVENGRGLSIRGSNASGNLGDGIHLRDVNDSEVRDSAAFANGAGLRSERTRALLVDNLTARHQARDGIADLQSIDLRVVRSTLDDNGVWGLNATRTERVNATDNRARGNGAGGLRFLETNGTRVLENEAGSTHGAGIALEAVKPGAQVSGNLVTKSGSGIRFARTEFAQLRDNTLTIGPDQVGLRFDDELSYNNHIPTSNTVNGAPVHWYTALAGTEAHPVRLADVRSDVRGVTNVAQVMIYRSSYVDASGVVATNGIGRGVYLYRSSSVTLEGADVSDNALAGVELVATQSSRVAAVSAQGSGVGVRLVDSLSNVVTGVNASGASVGVRLASSARDNRIDAVEVNGTARGVVDEGWSGGGLLGPNAIADAGASKRVRVGVPLNFTDVVATYRHESARIVEQRWSWGDGTPDTTSTASALLKPAHAYAQLGRYRVDLTLTAADGSTLRDALWVDVVPPLGAPREVAVASGDGNATLTWLPPESDGGLPVTGYRVYRGENLSSLTAVATLSALRHVETGLTNGRAYAYAVAALNAEGEGPRAFAVALPAGAPPAPTALAAQAGDGKVTLTWQRPTTSNGAPIEGFLVLRATGNGSLALHARIGNQTAYLDHGLANGVRHTYALRAFNALGESPLSANVTATPLGPPGAPRALVALAGDASVVLRWAAPSSDGGTPVTGYRVLRATGNATPAELPVTLAANASTFRDTGLSNGERYTYHLVALNAQGRGPASDGANATPSAIDALRPLVYAHEPAPGASLVDPPARIGAMYVDNDGVVLESVALYLDGALVGARIGEAGAFYEVPAPLARGERTVRLLLRDASGNEANETWTFRIVREEELVARFVQSGHALEPARAAPGENVTARLAVRNVGLAHGSTLVRVLLNGSEVANATVELAAGEETALALPFPAPGPGAHEVIVGEAGLALVVALAEAVEEAAPALEEPTEPRRPQRDSDPPPREDAAETPFPASLALAGALAATALLRRRR